MRAVTRHSETERRHASDRRRFARGGRRPSDRAGSTPLVLVVDDDDGSCAHCESILAALHFAVTPAHSVEETMRIVRVLRPNLVVSHLKENGRLREEMRGDPYGAELPFIALEDGAFELAWLIEEIRHVLRDRSTLPFPASAEPACLPRRSRPTAS